MVNNVPGIYRISAPSGKRYIGQASRLAQRWSTHRWELRRGLHSNEALQRAAIKYGLQSLVFEVLELCSLERLDERELWHIEQHAWQELYNMRRTLSLPGRPKGRPLSEAHKQSIRAAAVGRVKSEDERRRIGDAQRGKCVSPETRAKIRQSLIGRVVPDVTRAKISKTTGSSGFHGVSEIKRLAKWGAYITYQRKNRCIGCFPTAEAAATARGKFLAGLQAGATFESLLREHRPPKALRKRRVPA